MPARQVPFAAAEQQPPLQAEEVSQAVPQVWVAALQACPVGQSAAALQPHRLAGEPARQAWPRASLTQVPQRALPSEQALEAVPVAHWPLERLQQPLLQAAVESHAVEHLPLLHAWPAGQSLDDVQPQVLELARQRGPAAEVVQSTQAAPEAAQASSPMALQTF